MSNDTDSQILQALERLGASFPWDTMDISVRRTPEGKINFMIYLQQDERGAHSIIEQGDNLSKCVADFIARAGERDPEASRERAIKELEAKLAKLKAAIFGPPPYRPGTRLAAGALRSEVEV